MALGAGVQGTNAASRDGDQACAGWAVARPRRGRGWRRQRWNEESEQRVRKRGKGHIERRQVAWRAKHRWGRVREAACRQQQAETAIRALRLLHAGYETCEEGEDDEWPEVLVKVQDGLTIASSAKVSKVQMRDMAVQTKKGKCQDVNQRNARIQTDIVANAFAAQQEHKQAQLVQDAESRGVDSGRAQVQKEMAGRIRQVAMDYNDWFQNPYCKATVVLLMDEGVIAEDSWFKLGRFIHIERQHKREDAEVKSKGTQCETEHNSITKTVDVMTTVMQTDEVDMLQAETQTEDACRIVGHFSQPSWAQVAADEEQQQEIRAMWAVQFDGRVLQMGGGSQVVQALLGAARGNSNFEVRKVADGVLQFDYDEPWPRHFICSQRGSTLQAKLEWRRAWLHREMRGLVMRMTGEVVVRGLQKFFNIGQIAEVQMRTLEKQQITEVTEKLDGQMLMGVVVDEQVQYWTRKGFTIVGITARRVATEEHHLLVQDVCSQSCTPVFELVGEQSKIKADEGSEPRLVLVAVRRHNTGALWTHDDMQVLAAKYAIQVVRRLRKLEHLHMNDLVDLVKGWKGREGVIVKFSSGTIAKVKSRWWLQAGYDRGKRQRAKLWKAQEQVQQQKFESRLHTRDQRLAITGFIGQVKVPDLFKSLVAMQKLEMVYKNDKLSVAIASFLNGNDRNKATEIARQCGWHARKAYSRRTRGKQGRRIEVYKSREEGA